jgi:hypothetical protein
MVPQHPSWFASRQPDWPPTFVEGHFPLRPTSPLHPLPDELEEFLAAGEAPIAFTPGTGHKHAAGYFSNALSALRALGRRGLFITTHPDQVPHPLPPEVLWQPHAPFDTLFPRLAMLVHHGGHRHNGRSTSRRHTAIGSALRLRPVRQRQEDSATWRRQSFACGSSECSPSAPTNHQTTGKRDGTGSTCSAEGLEHRAGSTTAPRQRRRCARRATKLRNQRWEAFDRESLVLVGLPTTTGYWRRTAFR